MLSRLWQKLWPHSLKGQVLLSLALALLLAQTIGGVLLYRAQEERRDAALIHAAAFRLLLAGRAEPFHRHEGPRAHAEVIDGPRSLRLEFSKTSPLHPGDYRDEGAESQLRRILTEQGLDVADIVVVRRAISNDAIAQRRAERQSQLLGKRNAPRHEDLLVAGVRQPDSADWWVVRVLLPPGELELTLTLIGQTLFIYTVLVGAMALILRRITRPLAALTNRLDRFADTQNSDEQLEPKGPDDLRLLIVAHNAMEDRITALLNEKNVMLGAIGHDLKTPLAALRVRIESVEDDAERRKMAATIEDITRSLDDILSLARVGRPTDPVEPTELSALLASVAEEYEDMGDPVELGDTVRIVMPLRATWLRRALRNLISNALRYAGSARASLEREGQFAVIRIEDDGPGIPDADMGRMLEPFTRGEPSRNTETGGAGLGLTLARAIAEQHGGTLALANRRDASGAILGLTATLQLPVG